jgi:hypothetical protein
MNRLYHSTIVIASLAVSIIALVATAPAAFAGRLVDAASSGPYAPWPPPGAIIPPLSAAESASPVTVVHAGATAWQVALIAVVAAVAAAVVTAIVLRVHGRTTKLRPTAS